MSREIEKLEGVTSEVIGKVVSDLGVDGAALVILFEDGSQLRVVHGYMQNVVYFDENNISEAVRDE
jgi:hypothetical protein